MARTNFEARDIRIHNLRMAAQARVLARWEREERKAERMIGELCRNGQTVFYCWPPGGTYFESSSSTAVVDHLSKKGFLR